MMLYSCILHMAAVGVKGLNDFRFPPTVLQYNISTYRVTVMVDLLTLKLHSVNVTRR